MPDEFELMNLGGLLVGMASARDVHPAVGCAREWGASCLGHGLAVAHGLEVEVSILAELEYLAHDLAIERMAGLAPRGAFVSAVCTPGVNILPEVHTCAVG
ncbi:hypothetical protein [Streptomyces sp. NBC_00439]|uniref:hypothetical protein n=1 Tax=Streptomyces sp. NBC_00439 TaxID=2903650 RepID=UPI0022519977|nr:hypothetical protein [Streptomyces sp. NBC_00439]MCX5103460.1 hypothetical protein [Streptomyces sp. NBC_00439]